MGVLALVPTCSASDIRKAYREAALKHHPDKVFHMLKLFCFCELVDLKQFCILLKAAGQSLTRKETKDERLWKEEIEGWSSRRYSRRNCKYYLQDISYANTPGWYRVDKIMRIYTRHTIINMERLGMQAIFFRNGERGEFSLL